MLAFIVSLVAKISAFVPTSMGEIASDIMLRASSVYHDTPRLDKLTVFFYCLIVVLSVFMKLMPLFICHGIDDKIKCFIKKLLTIKPFLRRVHRTKCTARRPSQAKIQPNCLSSQLLNKALFCFTTKRGFLIN